MKFVYFWGVYYHQFLVLAKYFSILSNPFLSLFLKGLLLKRNSLYFIISQYNFYYAIVIVKYSSILYFSSLLDIVVIDYPNRLTNRFELNYAFWNNLFNFRFYIKIFIASITPVLSLSSFYASSSWLEREAWDMYGIKFLLHKNLRRILTDYGFQGYPLRKDFPLIGFTELRFDDLYQSIFVEPVEATQKFRFFKFDSPWSTWQ